MMEKKVFCGQRGQDLLAHRSNQFLKNVEGAGEDRQAERAKNT